MSRDPHARRFAPETGRDPHADWLSFEEALRVILDACEPLPAESVPLEDALGRALSEDIHARVDHPPWDNSAMDGYAVRAEDVRGARPEAPVLLTLAGDVPAGAFPEGPLAAGTAVRVMTGAPVPAGATGVIRIERTELAADGHVAVHSDAEARRNIRRRGEDVARGDPVLPAGTELTPAGIGVLAMNGIREAPARRRPRIGILATGNELADFDELDVVTSGRKIMNSNTWTLAAQLRSAGADPLPLGIARDDPRAVRGRLEAALAADCDAILSTAGVSVGEHDEVKAALDDMGAERLFWRTRIRPGSPMTFALLPGAPPRPVFGLPGNPVSAMVTFEVFVRPALRKLGGHRRTARRRARVRTGQTIESVADLTHFFRVRLATARAEYAAEHAAPQDAAPAEDAAPADRTATADGPAPAARADLPIARLTGPQGSGILTSMAAADALLVVPEGVARLPAGATADAIPLSDWTAGE